MSQRSLVALVAVVLLAGAAGLIGYLHSARAADEPSGKLEDGPAIKTILPDLQKDLAEQAQWKRIRLDDVKLETKDAAKSLAFIGLWLIEGEGTAAEQKALHDWIKPRAAALLKKKLNAGAKPDPNLDKEIDQLDADVHGIAFVRNPVLALREEATRRKELDGAVFADASYGGDGRLQVAGYVAKDKEAAQTKLIDTLILDPAVVPASVLGTKAGKLVEPSLAALKPIDYTALKKRAQEEFAAEKAAPLLRRTRVDDVTFRYAKAMTGPTLVLHWSGLCLEAAADEKKARLKEALQKISDGLLPKPAPEKYDTDVSGIAFHDKAAQTLQAKVAADPALDGTLILGARFDDRGVLRLEGFIPEGAEAKKRLDALLRDKLKGTGLLAPEADKAPAPAKDEGAPAAKPASISLDELAALDWPGFLKGLRQQFADDVKNPLFRQTRVDRAYFAYVDDEPRIHFELIVLQPPGDAAQLRTRLEQRLQTYYAGKVKQPNEQRFKVVLPAAPFQVDPTPALQRLAATDPALDGVLFESAWFDADRKLNFDVIYDNAAGQGDKIKKLFADNEIARKYVKPALLDNDEPKLNPRTFVRWEEQRRALQGVLAASREPLAQRSRVDRLYFTYEGNDTSNRQLKVEGVSLHPGVAADNQKELAKTIQARFQAQLPGVEFKTLADGVAFLTSPVVALQAQAVERRLDDALFEDGVYDADGRLHLKVFLGDLVKPPQIAALVETPAAREALKPALGKRPGQDKEEVDAAKPFPWRGEGTGMAERFQRGFAASDVRAARQTRVDRAYFLYDKQATRQLHLEGVSLWDGLPKATLPEALAPVCRQLLPEPAYQVVADKVARKPNPAPALQDKLAGKPEFDGILFEDVGFDARGRLLFPAVIADSDAQRAEVRRLLLAPPLADGVLPADPGRRELEVVVRTFDWAGMLKDVRAWAAGPTAPRDARRTRLDRAYFTREDGGCQLQLVGATLLTSPEGDPAAASAVRARVAEAVGKRCLERLRPLKLPLPEEPKPLARAVVPAKRDLLAVLRGSVAERRSLDGVNVTDVVYDEAGKVTLEGHWLGEGQARELGEVFRDALQPESPVLTKYGTTLERLRVVRTDLLLRDLRKWLVDKTEVEEVLFDRLYFDALGKLRIDGFFTRPDDKAAAEKTGLEALLAYPIGRGLLGLDPDGIAKPMLEGKDIIHLVKKASLVEYLRKQVPADPTLDGIRIDRCWYDADAVFVLNGLEDAAGQSRGLKTLLGAAQEGAAFRGHLPAGWRLGKFTVVPLRKMLRCLTRVMPADPVYDGVTLDRAYHDAANHLVLTGAVTLMDFPDLDQKRMAILNQRREAQARKALAAAIEADPDWRLRLSYGGPDVVLKATPADLTLAERAFERAAHWYGHERKVARALADLDVTIFNNPADATAWYFRAVCELGLGDDAAARRDLRRVLAFAGGKPPLLDKVIDYARLELVQGINRATASQAAQKIAAAVPADRPPAALVKELCEEPLKAPVPDEAPGWDTPFVTRTPPLGPRCGPPCWMPR